jgi:ribosomal protein S18 acetylase RimI-like enzyme
LRGEGEKSGTPSLTNSVEVRSEVPRFSLAAPGDELVRVLYRAMVRDEVLAPLGIPLDPNALDKETPPADLVAPTGALLLVSLDGEPVAIGGVRDLETPVAEVKSMYVAPAARRHGIGRLLLERLEGIAAEHNCRAVRLDTASHMTAAIALYRDLGYREVPAYNEGPNADLWFERELPRR